MYDVDCAQDHRTGLLVALAEDDEDTRFMLKNALLFAGYDVIALRDGLALMTLVSSAMTDDLAPPDFIVADVRMPYVTGLQALQALQRTALTTPVVLMSAFMDGAMRSEATRWGAAAVLAKPFDPETLVSILAATKLSPAP